MFDCEVEGCFEKTEDFLCENHRLQAEAGIVVICENCLKILRIEVNSNGHSRVKMVKDCLRCKKLPHNN